MRRRRGIMGINSGGIPIIAATASGNPLSFVTDMVRPLKSLVIPFTPIQAAGTPSPDNILPISGWTGANIYNETAYDASVTPKLNISWQSSAGTIYGGTVTLNEDGSADLVSTRGNVVASSFSKISSWSGTSYVELSLPGASGTAGNAKSDFKCSMFKPGGRAVGNTFRISTKCYLFISPETTLEDMNAVASQIQVVYPLATPKTYHFDNVGQLITFAGTNNIWTDTNGTNTATYLKHQS